MKNTLLFILLFIFSLSATSQETITGFIYDDIGALSGANISIKNTDIGVVSNEEGNYKIKAKENDTLLISYIGYPTKEVVIGENKKLKTELEGSLVLDEVILNGYGTQKSICRIYCCGIYTTSISYFDNISFSLITEKLFPNPSSNGLFQLSLIEDYGNIQIQVNTISGQLVKINSYQNINKKVTIDLSQFPSGIYLVNIIADGKRLETKKAIRG